ncbi:helix-turn-helix domain-containing protein [Achromobacter xylosoxidans]|uniref:helix-turn-helix domain-containing protein n=1 Tax=Alcaligenes xylosoxydans xylosoxydans TaxID=85698 RepID=UPI0022B9061B|nr:helix-turn-helix domain-containing protein [Achromobacter xylosoxidans]MCZ8386630.1 helix-turn-helix domain-containing protein [Achromobacter xylosoxidans]MEC6411304.1 helix-turn-helix domain-containing protein [Achromobacter xylosoxidans]
MDGLIMAAARALASGDPLGALARVALRDDAPGLALRGIALAQLGDFDRARVLVRRAARAFGAREPVARARCVVAEAEIALASRDLGWPAAALDAARATLERHGDRRNAAYAGYLAGRRLILMGRLEQAEQVLSDLNPAPFPPALRAVHELALAGIALRRVQATAARAALARAARAARAAGIPALRAEVRQASLVLKAPAAHLHRGSDTQVLRLEQVQALLASDTLVIDACRYAVHGAGRTLALASRPVLFTLAQALGRAWPGDAPRDALIALAFRTRHPDDSHRARLRVEIGRLRAVLAPLAEIRATRQGFALMPAAGAVAVLTPPVQDRHAAVLALLADGQAWSSSALALASGASQRQVQRALDALAASGQAHSLGRGRARRWITPPLPGFATTLLLPAPLPNA